AIAVATLHDPPAEIDAATVARAGRCGAVDLFVLRLSDVADPEVVRGAVEREAPRVAQADRPDLVATGPPDVWVVPGDPVLDAPGRAVDVDPQDLAQQHVDVLGVVSR